MRFVYGLFCQSEKIKHFFNKKQLTIHEVVHDVPQRKAVVYALSTGKTSFGDWASDYAVFFTFDESGEKIVKLEEMIDSAFMKDFFPKFQGYMREQMAAPQAS